MATVDDTDDEPDRTLTFSLGALPDGYVPGAHEALILTVADNDVPIVSATFGAAAASVAEGVPYDVTVSLSQAPEREVALPISAARGANLAANEVDGVPSSLTFAADETSRSFTVTFADDAEEEGNETLTLTFGTLPFRVNSAGAQPAARADGDGRRRPAGGAGRGGADRRRLRGAVVAAGGERLPHPPLRGALEGGRRRVHGVGVGGRRHELPGGGADQRQGPRVRGARGEPARQRRGGLGAGDADGAADGDPEGAAVCCG